MRIAPLIAAALLLGSSAAMSASSDYYLKIEGVGRETPSGPLYLKVQSSGDLDGDGVPDDGVIKLVCSGDELRSAHYSVKCPRDPASGQASGKRMHKPMTIVKEWGAATPQLSAMKPTYDVKKVEGTGARAHRWRWMGGGLPGRCGGDLPGRVTAQGDQDSVQHPEQLIRSVQPPAAGSDHRSEMILHSL